MSISLSSGIAFSSVPAILMATPSSGFLTVTTRPPKATTTPLDDFVDVLGVFAVAPVHGESGRKAHYVPANATTASIEQQHCLDIRAGVKNIHEADVDEFSVMDGALCRPRAAMADNSCAHHMDAASGCMGFCETSAMWLFGRPEDLNEGQICREGWQCRAKVETSERSQIDHKTVNRVTSDLSVGVAPSITWGFGVGWLGGGSKAKRDDSLVLANAISARMAEFAQQEARGELYNTTRLAEMAEDEDEEDDDDDDDSDTIALPGISIPYPTITAPTATLAGTLSAHWMRDHVDTVFTSRVRALFTSSEMTQPNEPGCGKFVTIPYLTVSCGWQVTPHVPADIQAEYNEFMLAATDAEKRAMGVHLGKFSRSGSTRRMPPRFEVGPRGCPTKYREQPNCLPKYLARAQGGGGVQATVWVKVDCNTGLALRDGQVREYSQAIHDLGRFAGHLVRDPRHFNPSMGHARPLSKESPLPPKGTE